REARAVALERSAGIPIDDALRPLVELRDAGEILRLADGSDTTRVHRAREQTTIGAAERVIEHRVTALERGAVVAQADRLDRELQGRGGRLSDEQRRAIMLACSDRQLVIIEGQAGTGKSTTLTGIARAHHDAGRDIVVTSTAAVAAERLARDLHHAGVDTRHYSLAALRTAITNGTLLLGPQTTIIHDEAALASTREQQALLAAVEISGARLIAVGDPRQNTSVGAGGLWPHLEAATRDRHSQAVLTRNLRARDPADRRDQACFRDGHHELAVWFASQHAYVQHPFPAQGITADTAHLIVSAHATREGAYVALTRAREDTHVYAEASADSERDGDRLQALAERTSRTDPDLPSIATPLEQARTVVAGPNSRQTTKPERQAKQPAGRDHLRVAEQPSIHEETAVTDGPERDLRPTAGMHETPAHDPEMDPAMAGHADQVARYRRWPRRPGIEPARHLREFVRDNTHPARPSGWEP
ncbi:MAG: AAA family ATPase, partial [Solirubrobacteraceae bacterium]